MRGELPEMPAPGYKWNETPRLNRDIWRDHCDEAPAELLRQFALSHAELAALAERLPAEQLMEPGHYAWTRANSLATYLSANTASHYRFAIGILKRWSRQYPRERTVEKKP